MLAKPVPSEKDKKRFQKAMQLHKQGESREAIRLFDKVRKSWGDDADIWYLIALAHGQLGEIKDVIRTSKKALDMNSIHFGALGTLANAQLMQGDIQGALDNYKKSMAIKPNEPTVLDSYGRALGQLGRREEAIQHFEKIIQTNQSYAPAHVSLAKAYVEGGHPEKAFDEYQVALQIDPNLAEAHVGIANIYSTLGNHGAAASHYREALNFEPSMVHALTGLSQVLRHEADYDGALKYIEKAEKISSDDPYLIAIKADTMQRIGDDETAYDLLSELNERNQMPPLGVETFSRICRKFDVCDDALELINLSIEAPVTDIMDKQMLRYSAGNLLDKQKIYDKAFEWYRAANDTVAISYVPAEQEHKTDQIIDCFTKEAMNTFKCATTASKRPIFILGMPRSGSTLIEQILSSHSDVFGAGELMHIKERLNEIRDLKPGAEGFDLGHIADLSEKEMTGFADRYLEDIEKLNSDACFVTDKMPHNFLAIGLIDLLFPEARIIHCRRNPLDNALSIYFQSFLWAHNYATDLANIGHFYNEYRRLMKHWGQVINIPMLHVDYEEVVEDSEAMSRKILEFCNLEWQDSVLDFHQTGRAVATASFDQVRQPIYKTSRERWKNYEQHIEPLRSAISPEYLAEIREV
jgi:tetratricopeptide (TPR) repeat protein